MLNFHAKLWTEDIFKLTTGNDSLHKNSTDSSVIWNLATSNYLVINPLAPELDI